jgi:hypothetical protein
VLVWQSTMRCLSWCVEVCQFATSISEIYRDCSRSLLPPSRSIYANLFPPPAAIPFYASWYHSAYGHHTTAAPLVDNITPLSRKEAHDPSSSSSLHSISALRAFIEARMHRHDSVFASAPPVLLAVRLPLISEHLNLPPVVSHLTHLQQSEKVTEASLQGFRWSECPP